MEATSVTSRHSILVAAAPDTVYRCVLEMNLCRVRSMRWLFRLRGLPASAGTLPGLERVGFVQLGREPGHEVVLGIAGRFWTPSGSLVRVTPGEFERFDRRGFAKATWSFAIAAHSQGKTCLQTETRVRCYGRAASAAFVVYWTFVGPFSGWIRRATLRLIKRDAEGAEHPTR
jgi:hypothetical protein